MVKAMRNYSTIFPNKNAWQLMDNKENESMESYDLCILKEHGIKKGWCDKQPRSGYQFE